MAPSPKTTIVAQLKELADEFASLAGRAKHDDLSDIPDGENIQFITRARAAIHRIAGDTSPYATQCEEIILHGSYAGNRAQQLIGVINSLRADVAAGFLDSQRELIHGELFADFLEMAQHLLDEGYKDASAVIAGSALEAHLRQLCQKMHVEAHIENDAGVIPKKADRLNADLTKAEAYSKLDQKSVTAWLDLRNKAAHGQYDLYHAPQVAILITGIRDFIVRNPA